MAYINNGCINRPMTKEQQDVSQRGITSGAYVNKNGQGLFDTFRNSDTAWRIVVNFKNGNVDSVKRILHADRDRQENLPVDSVSATWFNADKFCLGVFCIIRVLDPAILEA